MQDTSSKKTRILSPSKRGWALGALIAATSASVVLSLSAWAGGDEGMSPGMMGGHHCMHGGEQGEPGGMMAFGGHRLDHMLAEAKATDAQRTQIKAIADKAQVDLKALHEQGRAFHEQGLKLWAQPKLDAAAIEKLRLQMSAHHDQVSKRMAQALIEVGNVLTAEQRATIAQQMQKHHESMMKHMMERGRAFMHGQSASGPDRQVEGK
jgi:protein CpxP